MLSLNHQVSHKGSLKKGWRRQRVLKKTGNRILQIAGFAPRMSRGLHRESDLRSAANQRGGSFLTEMRQADDCDEALGLRSKVEKGIEIHCPGTQDGKASTLVGEPVITSITSQSFHTPIVRTGKEPQQAGFFSRQDCKTFISTETAGKRMVFVPHSGRPDRRS